MFKNALCKIFSLITSPITGWQFFITILTIGSIGALYYYIWSTIGIFFNINYIVGYSVNALLLAILVLAAFKRLIDIYGGIKKAFCVLLFVFSTWVYSFIRMMMSVNNIVDNAINTKSDNVSENIFTAVNQDAIVICCQIISIIFFISLIFFKSHNNIQSKLKVKTIFKRILVTFFIWYMPNLIIKPLNSFLNLK